MTIIDYVVAPRLERPEDWRQQAACAETDPELWFPDGWHESPDAIAICNTCPVRQECLDDALRMDDNAFGIRGGLYPSERRKLTGPMPLPRPTDCRRCGEPLTGRGLAIYHKECAREAKAERNRMYRAGLKPVQTCLTCSVEIDTRRMYCVDCAERRRRAQVAVNNKRLAARRKAKQFRQCSWCGLNTKAKDGLHPECATKRARALDGLEVGQ